MRNQRLTNHKKPAINAFADALPFDDKSFDAAMAMVTVHHWPNMKNGLNEIRRVTRNQIIVMTFDPQALDKFWNAEYFPELIDVEKQRYPSIEFLVQTLGGNCEVQKVPVPLNCIDGFQEAFYGRPEAFLSKKVREAQSAWGFIPESTQETMVKRLADDLKSGGWDRKYSHFRTQSTFTCALRLVIAYP